MYLFHFLTECILLSANIFTYKLFEPNFPAFITLGCYVNFG